METIDSLNKLLGQRTWNPLVSIVDSIGQEEPENYPAITAGVFIVAFRNPTCNAAAFGCQNCDFRDMTVSFYAPGETIVMDSVNLLIAFHADLFTWTSRKKRKLDYTFFFYKENESLHISKRESLVLLAQIENMRQEMMHYIDNYSNRLLASQLATFLDYCQRYYERQFIMREAESCKIIAGINHLLESHIFRKVSSTKGLPPIPRMASELGVSSAYLNDLMRVNTGKAASAYMEFQLVDMAKRKLSGQGENIAGIANVLGFSDVAAFSRLFKKISGITPEEYCTAIN